MQYFQAVWVSFSTSLCTCFVQVPLAPHTEVVAFVITNVTLFTAMLSQLLQHTHYNLSLMYKLTRTFLMLQWQRWSKTVSHATSCLSQLSSCFFPACARGCVWFTGKQQYVHTLSHMLSSSTRPACSNQKLNCSANSKWGLWFSRVLTWECVVAQ